MRDVVMAPGCSRVNEESRGSRAPARFVTVGLAAPVPLSGASEVMAAAPNNAPPPFPPHRCWGLLQLITPISCYAFSTILMSRFLQPQVGTRRSSTRARAPSRHVCTLGLSVNSETSHQRESPTRLLLGCCSLAHAGRLEAREASTTKPRAGLYDALPHCQLVVIARCVDERVIPGEPSPAA